MISPKSLTALSCSLMLLGAIAVPPVQTAAQEPTPQKIFIQKVENPGESMAIELKTDKAVYSPGEYVIFTASELVIGAKIRYRYGADVVGPVRDMTSTVWSWRPPTTDFRGYMAEVYSPGVNGEDVVYATIAVDVSSDWARFPRYGFVATFDDYRKSAGVVDREMAYLNRCHINGVQFQDWHNKHHWPLGGTRESLEETYNDIANRPVSTSVIKNYIVKQHAYGMKSIFYNLCFGVLADAETDGVSSDWFLYNDKYTRNQSTRNKHALPDGWKSDIYLVDPANAGWQEYLGQRNDDVYFNFDFDGYQIDQLGYRGDVYDAKGNAVDLPSGYASFINAMKAKHPDKRLIMNAVSSYGSANIIGTGKVDFCYNETWQDEAAFSTLRDIVAFNADQSNGTLRTVFAAYMNYDKASGYMNTPGVLLTDAVMMALGASHLELGDHMLSSEYFPNEKLAMSDELMEAIIHYYDFMTAYQNLLRDNYEGTFASTEFNPQASYEGTNGLFGLNNWPPQEGNVVTYARKLNGKEIVHLLNFRNAGDLSWRDIGGSRTEPQTIMNIPVKLKTGKENVSRVWAATPDNRGGAVRELPFEVSDGYVTVTVPTLKYWTMIVIE